MSRFLRTLRQSLVWRARLIGLVLVAVVSLSPHDEQNEGIGTNLQIALPLLAWGCEAINGQGAEYFVRFIAMNAVLHGTKQGLGDSAINHRPNGGLAGFPSGHTVAAVFGASSLARSCIAGHPIAQGGVILTAALTGGSRVSSGAHDIWQVIAGAVLGWFFASAFRRPGPVRRWAAKTFRRA